MNTNLVAWVSCCIWRTLRLCIQVNILIRDVWICQLLLKIVVHEAKLSAGVEHGGHCRHYAQVTLLPLYGHCKKVIEGSGITICPSCHVFLKISRLYALLTIFAGWGGIHSRQGRWSSWFSKPQQQCQALKRQSKIFTDEGAFVHFLLNQSTAGNNTRFVYWLLTLLFWYFCFMLVARLIFKRTLICRWAGTVVSQGIVLGVKSTSYYSVVWLSLTC